MKLILTILFIGMMSQMSLGDSSAQSNRKVDFIADTEASFSHGLEIMQQTEVWIKNIFKILPTTDAYEKAKENLRAYLGIWFELSQSPTHCISKLQNATEEFSYLIDVADEQRHFNADEDESEADDDENEADDNANEVDDNENEADDNEDEADDNDYDHDLNVTEVSEQATDDETETETETPEEDNDTQQDQDSSEETATEADKNQSNENSSEENNEEETENNGGENVEQEEEDQDEEEEEEQEEEDPASYEARLHVANLLRETATPEFITEFKDMYAFFQSLPEKINKEMRSADFDYSMELFELITKQC